MYPKEEFWGSRQRLIIGDDKLLIGFDLLSAPVESPVWLETG